MFETDVTGTVLVDVLPAGAGPAGAGPADAGSAEGAEGAEGADAAEGTEGVDAADAADAAEGADAEGAEGSAEGTEGVRRFAAGLCAAVLGAGSDSVRIEVLRALEELKSAAAAAQAQLAVDLDTSVRAAHAAAGVPREERGRGVGAQVALARRESAHRGGRHLGVAKALVGEMPHTLAALREGRLSEWRATLLVRETACLTVSDRATVDVELCADPATLAGVGDARLVALAKTVAYRLDPASVVRRRANAERDRRVTIRPAPDTMVRLSALLPVAQGVAAFSALCKAADTARATGDTGGGDERTRSQLMADILVARLTGRDPATGAAKVVVRLVMTDRALLGGAEDPAWVPGYGPVPAELARDLLARAIGATGCTGGPGTQGQVWLRRLFTHPDTGELVAMDARSRRFPDALGELLRLRDQTCRTPWCDAPIRHLDHATPAAHGGATSAANGQGLCEACNYNKQAPGWTTRPHPDSQPGAHLIQTTTPTGHHYLSRPPPLPGAA